MPPSVVVATLIADPDQLRLSDAHIQRAAQGAAGFESWRWLNEGVAADLVFSTPLETIRANELAIVNGKLTGKVVEPILGHDAKLGALKEIAVRSGLALSDTLAVGDGANDLKMLQAAGLGVAYRAKPKVAANAHARIDHSDLTALLYAQGIARADFVAG